MLSLLFESKKIVYFSLPMSDHRSGLVYSVRILHKQISFNLGKYVFDNILSDFSQRFYDRELVESVLCDASALTISLYDNVSESSREEYAKMITKSWVAHILNFSIRLKQNQEEGNSKIVKKSFSYNFLIQFKYFSSYFEMVNITNEEWERDESGNKIIDVVIPNIPFIPLSFDDVIEVLNDPAYLPHYDSNAIRAKRKVILEFFGGRYLDAYLLFLFRLFLDIIKSYDFYSSFYSQKDYQYFIYMFRNIDLMQFITTSDCNCTKDEKQDYFNQCKFLIENISCENYEAFVMKYGCFFDIAFKIKETHTHDEVPLPKALLKVLLDAFGVDSTKELFGRIESSLEEDFGAKGYNDLNSCCYDRYVFGNILGNLSRLKKYTYEIMFSSCDRLRYNNLLCSLDNISTEFYEFDGWYNAFGFQLNEVPFAINLCHPLSKISYECKTKSITVFLSTIHSLQTRKCLCHTPFQLKQFRTYVPSNEQFEKYMLWFERAVGEYGRMGYTTIPVTTYNKFFCEM